MRQMETMDQAIFRLKSYASALYRACFQRALSMVQKILALCPLARAMANAIASSVAASVSIKKRRFTAGRIANRWGKLDTKGSVESGALQTDSSPFG